MKVFWRFMKPFLVLVCFSLSMGCGHMGAAQKVYVFNGTFSYGDVTVKESRSPHGICTSRELHLVRSVGLGTSDVPTDVRAVDANCDGQWDFLRSRDAASVCLLDDGCRRRLEFLLTFLLYATLPIKHHPTVW